MTGPIVITLPVNSARLRIMRHPLITTRDRARAERSRWTWGEREPGVFTLSILGLLHAAFRLQVWVEPAYREEEDVE